MSTSAQQIPAEVQLKVVTVNKEQSSKTSNGVASSKIFPISFSYQKKAFRTKVMKVIYAKGEPMYKLVMPCELSGIENCVYWMQRKEENEWTVVMGSALEKQLLKAVTSAIGCLE